MDTAHAAKKKTNPVVVEIDTHPAPAVEKTEPQTTPGVGRPEITLGVACLLLWFLLFAGGFHTPTEGARKRITTSYSPATVFGAVDPISGEKQPLNLPIAWEILQRPEKLAAFETSQNQYLTRLSAEVKAKKKQAEPIQAPASARPASPAPRTPDLINPVTFLISMVSGTNRDTPETPTVNADNVNVVDNQANPLPRVPRTLVLIDWINVLLFWTVTNIGLMSCLAGLLGAFGRRTRFALAAAREPDRDFANLAPVGDSVKVHYASALVRGFGIYGLIFSGLLVLATGSLQAPGQDDYLRLAATVSVLSFYAGYDPSMFARLLDRARKIVDTREEKAAA